MSNEKKENYNCNPINNMDLDQAKSKYQVLSLDRRKAMSNLGVKLKTTLYSNFKVNISI